LEIGEGRPRTREGEVRNVKEERETRNMAQANLGKMVKIFF